MSDSRAIVAAIYKSRPVVTVHVSVCASEPDDSAAFADALVKSLCLPSDADARAIVDTHRYTDADGTLQPAASPERD